MSKEPTIGHFIDAEEEEIYRAVEAGEYVSAKSELTPERIAELRKAARFTLNGGERTQISVVYQVFF